jgi:hypothetical protein
MVSCSLAITRKIIKCTGKAGEENWDNSYVNSEEFDSRPHNLRTLYRS